MSGEALALAAERFVGAPFRLHGRDPESGLDCIGLLAAALEGLGRSVPSPAGYRLCNRDIDPALSFAPLMGLKETDGAILPGDVLLVRSGPLQHHLLIAGPGSHFIHAHAGLRRVVATPGPLAWPILRHWRLTD